MIEVQRTLDISLIRIWWPSGEHHSLQSILLEIFTAALSSEATSSSTATTPESEGPLQSKAKREKGHTTTSITKLEVVPSSLHPLTLAQRQARTES